MGRNPKNLPILPFQIRSQHVRIPAVGSTTARTDSQKKGGLAMSVYSATSPRLAQRPIRALTPKSLMHENASKCTVSAKSTPHPAFPERAQRVEVARPES